MTKEYKFATEDEVLENYRKADMLGRFIWIVTLMSLCISVIVTLLSFMMSGINVPVAFTDGFKILNEHVLHTFVYCFLIQISFAFIGSLTCKLVEKIDYTKYTVKALLWTYLVVVCLTTIVNLGVFIHTLLGH